MNNFTRPYLEAAFSHFGLTPEDARTIRAKDADGFQRVNAALRKAYFDNRGVFTYADLSEQLSISATRVRQAFDNSGQVPGSAWKRRNEARAKARTIAAEAIRAAAMRAETFADAADPANALVLHELNRIAGSLQNRRNNI